MRTIQSRIGHCKNRVPISSLKTAESLQLQRDVDEFIKNGGKIKVVNISDANFKSDIEKSGKAKKSKYFHIPKSTYNKSAKPKEAPKKKYIDLSLHNGLDDNTLICTSDLIIGLGVKSDASILNYASQNLIPPPRKFNDIVSGLGGFAGKTQEFRRKERVKNHKNRNYWLLGELRKHNKEL